MSWIIRYSDEILDQSMNRLRREQSRLSEIRETIMRTPMPDPEILIRSLNDAMESSERTLRSLDQFQRRLSEIEHSSIQEMAESIDQAKKLF